MEDCGFSEDLYTIREKGDEVMVEVDEKGVAVYIRKDRKRRPIQRIHGMSALKNGKRHRITFFLW